MKTKFLLLIEQQKKSITIIDELKKLRKKREKHIPTECKEMKRGLGGKFFRNLKKIISN